MRSNGLLVLAACFAFGGVGLAGCMADKDSSTDLTSRPSSYRPGFAGGNGEFGESPEQAGRYGPAPANQGATPAAGNIQGSTNSVSPAN